MPKPQGRKGPQGGVQKKRKANESAIRKDDVYEADDSDPEEDKNTGDRYDRVDNFEYELPANFEDEEIDEDEAFNSEDERRYGHLFGSKGGASASEDDEDEDESGSEDDLLNSEEEESSGSEDDEEEEEDSELEEAFARAGAAGGSDEEEEEEDEGAFQDDDAAREAMVRAITGGGDATAKERRRRRDVVVTEAYPESEFNLPAAGAEGELTLADLIAGLGDSRAQLGAARKTLEKLEKKAAPVAAPLPGPIRDRQERKAGYEAAKKDITKWVPVVKAHREAPTLHFKADVSAVPRTVTTASLAAKHEPETAMEAEVAALLQAAGAQTAVAVAEAEEALAMKALTVGEAKERREKLAKMRALLFYHEVKAKRLKKIKSKEYRRRLKKAEKRKAEGGDAELLLDEDAQRQADEDAEFQRAQERLTLKHRNTSRFIRRALKRGGANQMDEGTKQAVAEQLRLGEELRQRVHRMKGATRGSDSETDASDDESSGDSSSDEEENGQGTSTGGLSSKAKAAALEILQGHGGLDGPDAPTEGLFALPFMQRAMERRKAQAAEEARAVLEFDNDGADQHRNGSAGNGRMAFGGTGEAEELAQRVRRLEAAALATDSDESADEREDAEAKAERLGKRLRGEEEEEDAGAAVGGILKSVAQGQAKISGQDRLFGAAPPSSGPSSTPLTGGKKPRRGIEVTVGPKSSDKAGGAQQQQQVNGAAAAAPLTPAAPPLADAEAPEFITSKKFKGPKAGYVFKTGTKGVGYYRDAAAVAAAERAAAKAARQQAKIAQEKATQGRNKHSHGGAGVDIDSLDNEESDHMKPMGNISGSKKDFMGLSQEDLVRRAFAGDDIVAEFAAEKTAEVESELPSEDVPGALPGWGTWAGNKKEPRWAIEAKAKAAARKEAAAAGRKDSALQYVVISEKWDKKNAKYRTPTVPFPFDSRETYERTMRQPLGRDFNTNASFRNLTRPAVVKDAGVIIQPVRFSAAMAEHAKEEVRSSKRPAVLTVEGGMPKRAKMEKNKGGAKGKK